MLFVSFETISRIDKNKKKMFHIQHTIKVLRELFS